MLFVHEKGGVTPLNLSFKRTVFFLIVSSALFVNLAIQVARFNSLTTFLRNLKVDVSLVNFSANASGVDLEINLSGTSKVIQKQAFVSSAQLFLKIGSKDLGYHRIVGVEGLLAQFKGKSFSSVVNVRLTGYEANNFESGIGRMPITYDGYVVVHTFSGGHGLRSVMPIKGTMSEEGM